MRTCHRLALSVLLGSLIGCHGSARAPAHPGEQQADKPVASDQVSAAVPGRPPPDPNTVHLADITGSTCKPLAKTQNAGNGVVLTQVFAGISPSFPVAMQQPQGDSSRWFMIEQSGKVSVFPNRADVTEAQRTVALDLRGVLYNKNEAGLLGLALDPDFIANGAVYLSYTVPQSSDPTSTAVFQQLVRYTAANAGNVLDPNGTLIFSQSQYFDFHLGGNIQFGPDGMLYFGMGFNDTANDPAGFSQDLNTWRGKMLRIDVSQSSASAAYRIPADNPFVSGGGLPEIWALGLRNPWRWSFDAVTGALWLGDVGQDLWEEVDVINKGNNYGWPMYEGAARNPNAPTPAPGVTYTPPLVALSHAQDICITGGYVYRGRALPNLTGTYLFGDCLAGHIYALDHNATTDAYQARLLLDNTSGILSFAQDNTGEIYVLGRDGTVHRLDPSDSGTDAGLPAQLSQTGCTDANDVRSPAPAMLPYSVRVPFWSDGAQKQRFVALPSGAQLSIDTNNANNHVELPPGTVLMKHFAKLGKRIETRLFMRYTDGTWGGVSYAWDANQTDATLVPAQGASVTLDDGSTWNYPSRNQCNTCHSAAPGFSLGWQVAQLNTPVTFASGAQGNQLQAFIQYGLLSPPAAAIDTLPQLADPNDSTVSVATQARTYLHVNCGVCHQPGGLGLGTPDFRLDTPLAQMGVCNVIPSFGTFGLSSAMLLNPGNAAASVMSYRMHNSGAARMPAISSGGVDPQGTTLVDAWINSLTGCR